MREIIVKASGAVTTTANGADFKLPDDTRGVLFILNQTAHAGTTPTLDIKFQWKDHISGSYIDIPGAAFAQRTTTDSLDSLVVAPGATVAANRSISTIPSRTMRAVYTVAGTTPSYTFSLSATALR